MRPLLYSAAFALLAGAAYMLAPAARATAGRHPQEPEGIEPLNLDAYGEPEPELVWYDFGTIWDTIEETTGMTTTTQQDAPALQYFSPIEFGDWWPHMDADLLRKLDNFRHRWGAPVQVSPAPGALGRHAGDSGSYHNVDRWGAVRAVDVFPAGLTPDTAARAVEAAKAAGLGGIGLYTDTQPSMMMHLDNRSGSGRWARIDGQYVGIKHAMA